MSLKKLDPDISAELLGESLRAIQWILKNTYLLSADEITLVILVTLTLNLREVELKMSPSKKKNAELTYGLLYEVLDVKRSIYSEWVAKVVPNPKWTLLSSGVLLFIRILRDSIRKARMLPCEMNPKDWDTVFNKITETPLNRLREYNLLCNFFDGSVKLSHQNETIEIQGGLVVLLFSDLVDQHLFDLSNIGSDRPNNVTLLSDRSKQYYGRRADADDAS